MADYNIGYIFLLFFYRSSNIRWPQIFIVVVVYRNQFSNIIFWILSCVFLNYYFVSTSHFYSDTSTPLLLFWSSLPPEMTLNLPDSVLMTKICCAFLCLAHLADLRGYKPRNSFDCIWQGWKKPLIFSF